MKLLQLDASCPITEAQKCVYHSTGAELKCKSKTLLSWQVPQGGAEQSYRAQTLELSPSTQVTGTQAMAPMLSFALNQLIIYLKHSPF